MTRLARQNGLTLEQFRNALEQSGQSYAVARESLRDDLAIQRVQQGNVMRNINISEQEIDNFLNTEEGETAQPDTGSFRLCSPPAAEKLLMISLQRSNTWIRCWPTFAGA